MLVLTEDLIITLFAFFTTMLCALTFLVLTYLSVRAKDYRFTIIATLSLLVLAWFSVGYLAILGGVIINTVVFFRPMLPIMAALLTGVCVLFWNRQEQFRVLEQLRVANNKLVQTKKEIEGRERA